MKVSSFQVLIVDLIVTKSLITVSRSAFSHGAHFNRHGQIHSNTLHCELHNNGHSQDLNRNIRPQDKVYSINVCFILNLCCLPMGSILIETNNIIYP